MAERTPARPRTSAPHRDQDSKTVSESQKRREGIGHALGSTGYSKLWSGLRQTVIAQAIREPCVVVPIRSTWRAHGSDTRLFTSRGITARVTWSLQPFQRVARIYGEPEWRNLVCVFRISAVFSPFWLPGSISLLSSRSMSGFPAGPFWGGDSPQKSVTPPQNLYRYWLYFYSPWAPYP